MTLVTLPAHQLETGDRIAHDGADGMLIEIDEAENDNEAFAFDLFLEPAAVLSVGFDQPVTVRAATERVGYGLWVDDTGRLHRARGRCDYIRDDDGTFGHLPEPGCACNGDQSEITLYFIQP